MSEEPKIVVDHSTKEANRFMVSLLEEAQGMEATACMELTVHRSATKAWPLHRVPIQPYSDDLFQQPQLHVPFPQVGWRHRISVGRKVSGK